MMSGKQYARVIWMLRRLPLRVTPNMDLRAFQLIKKDVHHRLVEVSNQHIKPQGFARRGLTFSEEELHASADPQRDGFSAAVEAAFAVEALEMGTNGSYAYAEFDGDGFVGAATADEVNDLLLARSEGGDLRLAPAGPERLGRGDACRNRGDGGDGKQFDEVHSPESSLLVNAARRLKGDRHPVTKAATVATERRPAGERAVT